ncbi:MAG: DUF523 domain-containing protein [Oscillospiraceae bacterium]|nr:DUF523 domain-containing protein [Oscillospiraceae bacterium]
MILVSACLLGENCKYNGGNNYDPRVIAYIGDQPVLPVCPEMLAGLGCPRTPIEIVDGVVTDRDGNVVDEALRAAVARILEQAAKEPVTCAVLKSRSPTCGVRQVYDGTFSGVLRDGSGILAEALQKAGYQVLDAEEV